jgi:hypothetical protein
MTRTIAGSLRALLGGIVDYAGLFPPAKLDMPTTVANYARYLDGDDAWMLGRLIVPAARLDELEKHTGSLFPTDPDDEPWRLGGVVAPADDPKLDADLERIAAFNARHAQASAGLATIGAIELRATTVPAIEDALDRIPDDLFPFFELPVNEDPRGLVAALAGSDAGAKVRTGGASVPAPAELARFIGACTRAGLPFKATAGLHHALAHETPAGGVKEFGFLNVFVAATLSCRKRLAEGDLAGVLLDGNLDAFGFTDDSLRYGEIEVATEQVEQTRQRLAISFGSCSFEEPLEHLQALNLL